MYKHFFLWLVVTLVWSLPELSAYVLPTDYIARIHSINRERMRIDDMTVDLEVTLYKEDGRPFPGNFEGRLYLQKPMQMRFELVGLQDTPEVLIESEGKRSVSKQSQFVKGLATIGIIPTLFATEGKTSEDRGVLIAQHLEKMGIAIKETTLKRVDEDVVFVSGALPWDADKPQMWWFKETFLPLYYQFFAPDFENNRHKYQVWFKDFGSPEAGNWFPSRVIIKRDDKPYMDWQLSKVKKNNNLPSTIFTSTNTN